MKKLMAVLVALAMVLVCMPVFADTVTESVPVSVTGMYNGSNYWANATYTYNVVDGVPATSGYISNGIYRFNYTPSTNRITKTFAFESGKSLSDCDSTIVIPYSIGAFTADTDYAAANMIMYSSNDSNGLFNSAKGLNASTKIVVADGYTTTGAYTFSRMPVNAEIILPNSLTTISNDTFRMVGRNVGSYSEIIIPDSVTSIGDRAFREARITTATIPANVSAISGNLFAMCNGLESVTFKGNIVSMGNAVFDRSSKNGTNAPLIITFEGKTAPQANKVGNLFTTNNDGSGSPPATVTVYYPADGVGYDDPDFQAKFQTSNTTTTFVPVGAPADPVITPDSGEAGEAGTTVVWGTAANVVASENGTDGEGNTIYSYESASGDAVEFGVEITEGEFAGFYPALGLKEGKFAIKFTGNAASDLLTQLYLKINGVLQD